MYKVASKLLVALLLISFVASLTLFANPVKAYTYTVTNNFYNSSGDGYTCQSSNDTGNYYASGWVATSGQAYNSEVFINSGQNSGNDAIYRALMNFDTSDIPANATISSAKLKLYVFNNQTTNIVNFVIQSGQPTYPHSPIVATDYNKTHYSGDYGSNSSLYIPSVGYWVISLTNTSLINKGGVSNLALRSSNDIAGIAPTAPEYIQFYATTFLEITYTVTGTYLYIFNGVFDEREGTGTQIGNCNVTAYFDDGTSPYTFNVNGTATYNPSSKPLYFFYNIFDYANTTDTLVHREYWLDADEYSGEYNIFGDEAGLTNIVFSVRALAGAGLGSFVEVQRYIDGSLQTVERRKMDDTGITVCSLEAYALYTVLIDGDEGTTTFNNIETYTSPIVLTVSALSFPSSTLQQYKYVRIYAARPTSTSITVTFEDTTENTLEAEYSIIGLDGIYYFNASHIAESAFTDVWLGADANITYTLQATITHEDFGTLTFSQILIRDGSSSSPIDLSFLGVWSISVGGSTVEIDATEVFWAFVILVIFGCFSALNSYVGLFAGIAFTVVFMWLQWINIPVGAVVVAFVIMVLLAISYWKKGGRA